jgi:hypothetical protein
VIDDADFFRLLVFQFFFFMLHIGGLPAIKKNPFGNIGHSWMDNDTTMTRRYCTKKMQSSEDDDDSLVGWCRVGAMICENCPCPGA